MTSSKDLSRVLASKSRIAIAPMVDKTLLPLRQLLRLMLPKVVLYTQMLSSSAIIHGSRSILLERAANEDPLVLQIGTNSPQEAYDAVKLASPWNYSMYNLNLGCPSARVQHRDFGAILMNNPSLVAEILSAMRAATTKPISLKQRIGIRGFGIDIQGSDKLNKFIDYIYPYIDMLVIHARIAILEGLSPKENRSIPPINYGAVYELKKNFPQLHMQINGDIKNKAELREQLNFVDSVMLGRIAYDDPWQVYELNSIVDLEHNHELSRMQLLSSYIDWLQRQEELDKEQGKLRSVHFYIWPLLQVFHGLEGAKEWRRNLSAPLDAGLAASTIIAQAMERLGSMQD